MTKSSKKHIENKGLHDEDLTNIGVRNKSVTNTYDCDICKDNGECNNEDVYECYNYYRKLYPTPNEEIEIWDMDKKIWIKKP